MIAALIWFQAAALTRQPTTIDFTTYREVQHALPNGAPDLAAPDNFYVRVQTHYGILSDSDKVTPGEDNIRHVHTPERKRNMTESFEESGEPSATLDTLFKAVSLPENRRDHRPRTIGSLTWEAQDQTIYKGNHFLMFECRTTVERTETHSDGKRRVTRINRTEDWSTDCRVVRQGQIVDPGSEIALWNGKPVVKVDPTVYGYLQKG